MFFKKKIFILICMKCFCKGSRGPYNFGDFWGGKGGVLKTEGDSLGTLLYLSNFFSFLKKDFIYLFLERGREREIEGEKHQCVVAPCVHPTRDLACNPGTCPDWESNQWPFASPLSNFEPSKYLLFDKEWIYTWMNESMDKSQYVT